MQRSVNQRNFFFSEIVIVITFIQILGKRKCSDKYCWEENWKRLWFFPVCRLNKGKSISSYQQLVMAPYPWVSLVGLGGCCWYFLHAGKVCDSMCCTHVAQLLTCAEYSWEKPRESQTLLSSSSQNSASSSSEGWLKVQISSSKAGFLNSCMEKSRINDTVSKKKGQPTANNFDRGLLCFFHVSVSPEFPTSAKGHELQATKAQESFRYTNSDKSVPLSVFCSGIVL